jgi:hypothetical protein
MRNFFFIFPIYPICEKKVFIIPIISYFEEIFAGHIPEFNTPKCEYPLLIFQRHKKTHSLFEKRVFLFALHHLFSFAGLNDECRIRMKCSGSDNAIVSEKIKKINIDNKFRGCYRNEG